MTKYQIQYMAYDRFGNLQSYDYKTVDCSSWEKAMEIGKQEKEEAVLRFFEGIKGDEDMVQVRVFPKSTEHVTKEL